MTNTVGAIISVLASVISNLGTNIQKEAHLQNEARADDQKIPYLKSCLWWLGKPSKSVQCPLLTLRWQGWWAWWLVL